MMASSRSVRVISPSVPPCSPTTSATSRVSAAWRRHLVLMQPETVPPRSRQRSRCQAVAPLPGLSQGAGQITARLVIRRHVVRGVPIVHGGEGRPVSRAMVHAHRGHHAKDRQHRRTDDSDEVCHWSRDATRRALGRARRRTAPRRPPLSMQARLASATVRPRWSGREGAGPPLPHPGSRAPAAKTSCPPPPRPRTLARSQPRYNGTGGTVRADQPGEGRRRTDGASRRHLRRPASAFHVGEAPADAPPGGRDRLVIEGAYGSRPRPRRPPWPSSARRPDGVPPGAGAGGGAGFGHLPLEQLMRARLRAGFRLLGGGRRAALAGNDTSGAVDWRLRVPLAAPERASARRLATSRGWTLADRRSSLRRGETSGRRRARRRPGAVDGLVDESLIDIVATEPGVAPGRRATVLETSGGTRRRSWSRAGEAAPRPGPPPDLVPGPGPSRPEAGFD